MQKDGTQLDQQTQARARRLCVMMNEYIRNMTDAHRDRLMQIHLAEARGTEMNAFLLRKAMNFALRLRAANRSGDVSDD